MSSSPRAAREEDAKHTAGGASESDPLVEVAEPRPPAPVDALTADALLSVLEFVDAYDLHAFAVACRDWAELLRDEGVWKAQCELVWAACKTHPSRWLRRHGGSWRALFLGQPHIRFDGLYVLETCVWRGATQLFAGEGEAAGGRGRRRGGGRGRRNNNEREDELGPRLVATRYYRVLRFLPTAPSDARASGGAVLYGLVGTLSPAHFAGSGGSHKLVHAGRYRLSRSAVQVRVDVGHLVMDIRAAFDPDWRNGHERLSLERLVGARPGRPEDPIEFPVPHTGFLFERVDLFR